MKQTNGQSLPSHGSVSRGELPWAGGFYLLSAIGLALSLSGRFGERGTLLLGVGLTALSMAAQARLARSAANALGHIVTLALIAFFLGSPVLAGILGATLSACCSFACFCRWGGRAFAPALPLLSFLLSALILRDPILGALSLTVLPPALTLLLCLRKRTSRIPAICRLSVTLLAVALPTVGYFLYRHLGSLSYSALRLFLDEVRLGATAALTEALELTGTPLGVNVDAAVYADTMVSALFNVLPALTVIGAMLISYGIHTAALRCLIGQGEDKEILGKMLSFDMSLVSALLYFAALLLSLILVSEQTALFGAVAQNVYLILAPGMLMTAWIAMNALLFSRAPSCLSTLLYFGVVFLLFQFPTIMLPLASAFGAGVVILGRIRLRPNKKNS